MSFAELTCEIILPLRLIWNGWGKESLKFYFDWFRSQNLPQWFGPASYRNRLVGRPASKCRTLSSTLNSASTTNTAVRPLSRPTQIHLDSISMPCGRRATTRNVSLVYFDRLSIRLTIDLRIWSTQKWCPNCRKMPTFDTVHSILLISPAKFDDWN